MRIDPEHRTETDRITQQLAGFDNSRRLRALVTELEGVSLRTLDDDPRWGRK